MRPFGKSDKFGYMFGDLANDFFFIFISSNLMLFYTDILGISAASVGTLFLLARIIDAFADVTVGGLIDSRNPTKHGKFRPYLIKFAIPVSLFGLLTFTAIPGLPAGLKLPYAYVTYIIYGILYSAINIPYGSLASVITNNPLERTSLSTFRTMGSLLAAVIVSVLAPMFIFDANRIPKASGFFTIAVIFMICSVVFYFLCFKMTTERITYTSTENHKFNFKETLKSLGQNKPLLALIIASLIMMTLNLLIGALTPYLFKDYFKDTKILSLVSIVTMPAMLIALPFLKPLVAKFGKKEISAAGLIITILSYGLAFILPFSNPWVYIMLIFSANLGMSCLTVLTWAMVADVIDYHELITGKREEGTIYSIYSFSRKLGQAIAGGLGGYALVMIGYVEGAKEQSLEVAMKIKQIVTLVPTVGYILMFIILAFVYNLSKSNLEKLNKELEAKRM